MTENNIITNRYDFALVFEVKDGNPNGDPDAGNLPRIDPETGHGIVTDVCLKRKVRNFVSMKNGEKPPYNIYIKEKAILNRLHEEAYEKIGAGELLAKADEKKRKGGDRVGDARQWMCQNYFDVRTFGAVMSTGVNCGQVRGPVQMTFGRSVDPIVSLEYSITRMAVATEAEAEKQGGDNRTMGRKFTVPYGLYISHGFISAHLAKQTGFGLADLEIFWESLLNMFDHDRSAARGEMSTRKLIVFKHSNELGDAPAHDLFGRISIMKKDPAKPARSFDEYEVKINRDNLPNGISIIDKR